MTSLVIYCASCGGRWEMFERDDFTDNKYATCPHCGKVIDNGTWNKYVLPAFGCVADANRELVKDALNVGERGFSISTRSRVAIDKRMRNNNHEVRMEK